MTPFSVLRSFFSMLSVTGGIAAALVCTFGPSNLAAQTVLPNDSSTLKQIIIFGRHGVRNFQTTSIQQYAVRPYPNFGVPLGYLTPHGYQAEFQLGSYLRQYLLNQELLTGNSDADLKHSYFRANSLQRSNISADALGAALLPGVTVPVHSFALGTADPVFDPIASDLVPASTIDTARAQLEDQGIFGSGAALTDALAPELALLRSVLFNEPLTFDSIPPAPSGLIDPTIIPITITANPAPTFDFIVQPGGLLPPTSASDPFVMEYTDGLPMYQVAWGQLSREQISQLTRFLTVFFRMDGTSPYIDQVQSSNAGSHILRTLEQGVIRDSVPGAFGDGKSKLVVVNSSDGYVAGLAGLLRAHWLLPGYQPDYCAPGGALVFELREKRNGDNIVRVFYTSQTFDQLRNLTPLSLDTPPATQQLYIPDGSESKKNLDVDFSKFEQLMKKAINEKFVQNPATEVPPGVLTGVPLS